MHSVSWITAARTVRSIATPSADTAWQLWTLLNILGLRPRIWLHQTKRPRLLA